MHLFNRKLPFLLVFFTQSLWAQTTFNNAITRGINCSTTVTSLGMRLDCSGKGFITADQLPYGPTTTVMNITVLSADVPVLIGIGQRVDSFCSLSMFPEANTTWANCQSCNKYFCAYHKLATSTSSYYATSAGVGHLIQVGKKYNWQFIPGTSSSGQCWEIKIASKIFVLVYFNSW